MLLSELNPDTGLPKVHESRSPIIADPDRAQCTCGMGICRWHPIPRQPFLGKIHEAQRTSRWFPSYQRWENGTPVETRCWKCGTPIKGWRIKLNADGTPFEMPGTGDRGVWHALLPNYRAKPFAVYLPQLAEQVTFDVLHCADCEIRAEDGEIIIGCYLGGLWEAHRHAMTFLRKAPTEMAQTPDMIATMYYEWSRAEPIGPLHRLDRDSQTPYWRS